MYGYIAAAAGGIVVATVLGSFAWVKVTSALEHEHANEKAALEAGQQQLRASLGLMEQAQAREALARLKLDEIATAERQRAVAAETKARAARAELEAIKGRSKNARDWAATRVDPEFSRWLRDN